LTAERAEDSGFGGAGRLAVADEIDKHGDAHHVRQENEFLPLVGTQLAGGSEELDGLEPITLANDERA
jgi:hypothetical protein